MYYFPDLSQPSICKEETLSEPIHCELEPSICHTDPEPLDIKEEESHDIWPQHQEDGENEHVLEPSETNFFACQQMIEEDDPKPSSQPLSTNSESKCCQVCGKHYGSAASLTKHMAIHTGVKHRCHVCGKECSRKGDLKIHLRIHTGEKPFCCSYCRRTFTHSGHLRKHLRSHTGERPYRCHVCGKDFMQSTHLKDHLYTHRP